MKQKIHFLYLKIKTAMIGRLRLLFCLLVVTLCAQTTATPIDDLETMLRDNPQLQ